MWIHSVPVHQLLDYDQLTMVAGQKEAVQVILHMEICRTVEVVLVYAILSPHLVPETGIKPFQFDEVPHHLGVAVPHCLVETALSVIVQIKPAVSKFGHEILDNLQVATNGSIVEGIQKCLNPQRQLSIRKNTCTHI